MAAAGAEGIASGRLDAAGRQAASATALELLGTYFADAPTWELQHQRQFARGDAELGDLADAIRIRVALAAARRLDLLLHRIAARLSFHYGRVEEESIGAVRGRLDVPRYIRAAARHEAPRRYPVRVLQRHHLTRENVLAMYAAGWVTHEMRDIRSDILPLHSPERRELIERHASLARSLSHPVLAAAAEEANQVWRQGRLAALVDQVEARIEGGHIASPQPYEELVAWVKGFQPTAAAAGEDIDWSIYDDRFDPKLFEIWILHQIAAAVEGHLGSPTEHRPLWDRGATATYTWKLGGSSLRLHFQLALSGLAKPRWKWAESGKPFDGVPDVTAIVSTAGAGESATLVDAKLRRRERQPTEELYKLLGYFQNRELGQTPSGAIVSYSPGEVGVREMRSEDGGTVLSLAVDPALEGGNAAAFEKLARFLVDLLDRMDPGARSLAGAGGGEEETAMIQQRVVDDLLARGAGRPDSLEPYRHVLESQLPTIWPGLDEELKTILVTAEYFGATAPPDADLSGPVLGLCAACERMLCGPDGVLSRMAEAHPEHVRSPVTLGAAVLLKRAKLPRNEGDEAVRAFLDGDASVDTDAVLDLASDLLRLNGHRRAAAHTEVVMRDGWQASRGLVLGRGDLAQTGLLARLAAALSPRDA